MKYLKQVVTVLFITYLPIFTVWAGEEYLPSTAMAKIDKAPSVDIHNAKRVFPGILSGGQPTDAQLKEASQKGYKTVINLRTPSEHDGKKEADMVKGLGMKYLNIPIYGAKGVTTVNSQKLIDALSDPESYPVMIHCASGNRVGALFALDAAKRAKATTDEALQIGRQAGMTGLEGVVRKVLSK